ncbi:hypothetical protein E2P60_04795 [Candidatus Bathyarchaeota archaeon]|nr:hypothetical protein E2P60_04795 [Candidatus Bathyarchaeota archaeon]
MSAKELEKLQAMRAELWAEAQSLQQKQKKLENSVVALEEKVVVEMLKKERAAIEELKNHNKATKDTIAELAARKKKLETKLEDVVQTQAILSPTEEKVEEAPVQSEETQEAVESTEIAYEEDEDGVIVTTIEGEALVENQETILESPGRKEKKKRRFF